MKYALVFFVLITISFLSVNQAYGIWIPQSPEELLEESQVIVVGTITAVNELELEQPFSSEFSSLILDEYTVTVEEFVKNPQDTDTITVRQPTVSTPGKLVPHGGFEIGDRVLLYIESFDGANTYSKESFLIPKQCDTGSVIRAPRIIGSDYIMIQNGVEKKDNFTANVPIQFIAKNDMGTLSGDSPSIEYDAFISKQVGKIYKERVFHQTITADVKPCQWLSVAEWEFTPDVGNYLLNGDVYKEKSRYSISNTFFSVLPESPLKQIQSGIHYSDVSCRDDRVLVLKQSEEFVSCVYKDTVMKLFQRGWALPEVQIVDTDTVQQESKIIKITGIINRFDTMEGFEYQFIPLQEELPRIAYTGYDTINLLSTKNTVHQFIRDIDGDLVRVHGSFILNDKGEYQRHFSGFPIIPAEKVEKISENLDLEHTIDGAEIISITKLQDANAVNIVLDESNGGSLTITIPREIIDATIGVVDDAFFVLIDGKEIPYTETANDTSRTLTIDFEKGTRIIEIIGTVAI